MYSQRESNYKSIYTNIHHMNQTSPDTFKSSLLNRKDFTITYELVPGRGSGGKRLKKLLHFAEAAKNDGRIKAFSITDNPGGHPALAPNSLGQDIQSMGISSLIHFSLKDKNRNMVESQLFECHRNNLRNILVLGGDFPRYGYHGHAMPVFDLDSPQLLNLISDLKRGASTKKNAPGRNIALPPMDFFTGCVVSPFKLLESEQVWQYTKLLTKIASGAQYVISQLGFDMLKYKELKQFMQHTHPNIPLLANVFIPTLAVARVMNRGLVPGVLFPDTLLKCMTEEAQRGDNGNEARLLRAAQMIAALQKTGYDGVHIGGNNLDFTALSFLLNKTESFMETSRYDTNIHFPQSGTWYLKQEKDCPQTPVKRKTGLSFALNNTIHKQLFAPEGLFFSLAKKFSLACDRNKYSRRCYTFIEHLGKTLLFRCRMCGDCTLAEANYLCPQSGCPKKMINGPCGGSINGFCEVYPKERLCFWVRSFNHGTTPSCNKIQENKILPPKNWALNRSSSWLNYFTGKDHCKLKN